MPYTLGYSTESTLWSNGAYLKFDYNTAEFDEFFSSILPAPSFGHCPANMFVTFTEANDIDEMTMTTACTGLNIMGLTIPADTMEHRVVIILDEMIIIESDVIDQEFQVNEFLKFQQSSRGHLISMEFHANGSVRGEIKQAKLFLFGKEISTTLEVADKITFQSEFVFIKWKSQLSGVFETNQGVILNISLNPGSMFYEDLNKYMADHIENEIAVLNDRLDFMQTSRQKLEMLFYFYDDIVNKIQVELDEHSTSYSMAIDEVKNLTKLLNKYQTIIDALNISDIDEVTSICIHENCSTDCVIQEMCVLYQSNISFQHWGIDLVSNEEEVVVTYKTAVLESEWTFGYFCRLITNIKSWGKTSYGEICSYKSDLVEENKFKWVSENKDCNVSHYESVAEDYLVPLVDIRFLNQSSCGLYLQSSSCLISNAACTIAQLKMINSLEINETQQFETLENLLETRSSLSVAYTQAEEMRYKKQVAECKLDYYQTIVDSLYGQLSEEKTNYESILLEFRLIQQIKSLLLNGSTSDLVQFKQVLSNISINESTPSLFPLMISFESPALNVISELYVTVDFNSPEAIVKRDIALSVMNELIEQTKHRQKKSCDDSIELSSHNEKRFEHYCALLGNIKEYIIELNDSLNAIVTNSEDSKTNLVTYSLLTYADKEEIPIDIDMDTLNSFLAIEISMEELLNLSLSSSEYMEIMNSLQSVVNISTSVATTIDETTFISWYMMLTGLHETFNSTIVTEKVCFGFPDCFKTIFIILQKILLDSQMSDIPVINPDRLKSAEEQALRLLTNFDNFNHGWELLEPMYDIVSEVENSTDWCSSVPYIVTQPDPNIYAKLGSDLKLKCEADQDNVEYKWFKNGFPMKSISSMVLQLRNVGINDEGQYQCKVSNIVGYMLSTVFELHLYTSPFLTLSPSNVTTYEGNENDALFVCNATGHPTPQYYWYFSTDKINWTIVGIGSNEYLVYKPTRADVGWYRCVPFIFDSSVESDAAFLDVIGASISKISYDVAFSMAIYSIHQLHKTTDEYIRGLHESLIDAITVDVWTCGYFENIVTIIDNDASRIDVSFQLSAMYNYSLTKTIADQALEADHCNTELLNMLEKIDTKLRDASISFDFVGDFMIVFPQTFQRSDPTYSCSNGKELMKNTFICGKMDTQLKCFRKINDYLFLLLVNCSEGFYSTVIDDIPTCVECELGTYNGLVGQAECTSCPQYTSTLEKGSLTDDKCQSNCIIQLHALSIYNVYYCELVQCKPHTNSSNGLAAAGCQNCSKGFYQFHYGSTFCVPCSPANKTSNMFEECYGK